MANISAIKLPSGNTYDLVDKTSGYVTTDEKLVVNQENSNNTYYPIISTSSTAASTKYIDTRGIKLDITNGTERSQGDITLVLGNSTAVNYDGNKAGLLQLYGPYSRYVQIQTPSSFTSDVYLTLPSSTGTLALTSNIKDATLTIQKNGANVETFSANASSNKTANIVVNEVPSGGTTGQVLAKNSGTNYDVGWITLPDNGAYIVTFIYDDENETWSCDKTAQEIYEAYESGIPIIGVDPLHDEGTDDDISWEDNYSGVFHLVSVDKYVENGVYAYTTDFACNRISPSFPYVSSTSISVKDNNCSYDEGSFSLVPTYRKINNKPLSSDITLTASDVGAQEPLVSGTNIKTINNNSILGSGNIDIQSGSSIFVAEYGVTTYADVSNAYNNGATLLCERYIDGVTYLLPLFGRYEEGYSFYFGSGNSGGFISASVSRTGGWQGSTVSFATKDTATTSNNGLMSSSDKSKLDGIASGAEVNVQSDWNQSTNTADDYIKNKPTIPSKTSDLTNDSGFITGMTILSYGSSTWQNFIDAYNASKVVYCRASSSANPASGSQTRLAFMAYVNNATTPTEVEFQYYRSVSTHTASQQGDQVYVYKLNKTNGWSVTVREASVKVVAGTGLGGTYSNGTMTLTGPTKVSDLTNDSGFISTETDPTVPSWAKQSTKPTYTASEVGALPDTTTIPTKTSDLTNDSGFITLADLPIYNGGVS